MSRQYRLELYGLLSQEKLDTSQKYNDLTYHGSLSPDEIPVDHIGVRPHKEKINISKEIINKTRGAVAPYAARMNHTPLRGEQQATSIWTAEM